ncbi:MAG: glycosyltransferase [Kluyvera intermedia]
MSTYNGDKYLSEQLDSLLLLEGHPDIYIRDDGSTDKTKNIIKKYQSVHERITLIEGGNIGVVASFIALIQSVPSAKYSYYSFCDQDDFWEVDKVSRAIECIKDNNGAAMYCSTLNVVDASLEFKFLSSYPDKSPGLANALVENIVTGCTCVLNDIAFNKIKSYLPVADRIVMHDWWFYLVMSSLGSIYFDRQSRIKYRQHGQNVAGMKRTFSDIVQKFKKPKKSKYPPLISQLQEFQRVCGGLLSNADSNNLRQLIDVLSKRRKIAFICLVLNKRIYRQSIANNLSLIYSYFTGRI